MLLLVLNIWIVAPSGFPVLAMTLCIMLFCLNLVLVAGYHTFCSWSDVYHTWSAIDVVAINAAILSMLGGLALFGYDLPSALPLLAFLSRGLPSVPATSKLASQASAAFAALADDAATATADAASSVSAAAASPVGDHCLHWFLVFQFILYSSVLCGCVRSELRRESPLALHALNTAGAYLFVVPTFVFHRLHVSWRAQAALALLILGVVVYVAKVRDSLVTAFFSAHDRA
jgi:hypothetical protein